MRLCLCFFIGATFLGCSNRVTVETYRGKKISEIFNDGLQKLDSKSFSDATTAFKSIDDLYPYSATASTAQVFAAYSMYKDKRYQDAIRELELFMKYNPKHEMYAYAMYLRGVCFLKQVCSVGRSQVETVNAKTNFIRLLEMFPESDYAKEADAMLLKLDNSIAASEMNIGKQYQFEQGNPNAALGRYTVVASHFTHTNQAPEALFRMLECYLQLGLKDQAVNVLEQLRKAFGNSKWAKKADALVSKKRIK